MLLLGIFPVWLGAEQTRKELLKPTPAHPLEELYPEWAPAESVWMSLPLFVVREDAEKRAYFLEVLRLLAPRLPVYILYNEDQENALLEWELEVKADPVLSALPEGQLDYVPSTVQSEWLRDFGPLFGRGKSGELVLLDHGYRGLGHLKKLWQLELEAYFKLDEDTFERRQRESQLLNFLDDITPNFMASAMARRGREVELVKPPLFLSTGDFGTDGRGRVFITEDTLVENGGSRAGLRQAFKEYYNAEELHVLFATPGRSTRHLDMIFKLAGPDRVLLASPPPANGTPVTAQQSRLLRELNRSLEANRLYLERRLPDLEVFTLPLAPMILASREQIEREIREDVMDAAGARAGLDMPRVRTADPGSRLAREAAMLIREQMMKDLNLRSLEGNEWLEEATLFYLDRELDRLVAGFVEERVFLRTYLNSLHLRLKNGEELVLIPRYRAREGEDPQLFADLESEVLEVYREAYPGAELHWVDSDAVIQYMGSVHCTTIVEPAGERESLAVN